MMWKPNQPGSSPMTPPSPPEPVRPLPSVPPSSEPTQPRPTAGPSTAPTGEQATIGKSLVIKGEISGSETLYIDGQVEGSVNMPGNRVIVGRNGNVSANIAAREVVVLGKVLGNIHASDRVDIRSEGALTGDVIAQRISIEDGAFFKGGIDIRKPGNGTTAGSSTAKEAEKPRTLSSPSSTPTVG